MDGRREGNHKSPPILVGVVERRRRRRRRRRRMEAGILKGINNQPTLVKKCNGEIKELAGQKKMCPSYLPRLWNCLSLSLLSLSLSPLSLLSLSLSLDALPDPSQRALTGEEAGPTNYGLSPILPLIKVIVWCVDSKEKGSSQSPPPPLFLLLLFLLLLLLLLLFFSPSVDPSSNSRLLHFTDKPSRREEEG